MTHGTIAEWVVGEGEEVAAGDVFAEIETDKATVSFECQDDCFVAKILVDPGSEVPTGTPVMVTVMDEDGAWVVVLLDHTGDDWTVRFPVEPLHCISWSHLRVDAAGRRTLGINIDARTGRRRWAVGLVPRALLDQTVFNANPAGLRAAMNENFVEFQMVRAEVEPPPEL